MSRLLRHAPEELPSMRSDGFAKVSELLSKKQFRGITLDNIRDIVDNNDKKRYTMVEEQNPQTGEMEWWVRANQGHSFEVTDLELRRLTLEDCRANGGGLKCVHGTNFSAWQKIRDSGGLSRMARQHIHFATGLPHENDVISGMRSTSQVVIYVDIERAIADNIPFHMSANNVILSPGLGDTGLIPLSYFSQVIDIKTGSEILFKRK